MVKYVSIAVGVVIFAVFLSLMFLSTAQLGEDYNSQDAAEYTELSSNYKPLITEDSTKANSTMRKIQAKLDESSNPISIGADILVAAVDGVKLFFGSITTLKTVGDKVAEDSGGRIHPLIITAIGAILTIVFVIIVVSMLMRFKPET